MIIIPPFVTILVSYFGIGYEQNLETFWTITGTVLALVMCTSGIGLSLGTIFSNPSIGLAVTPVK